MDDLKDRVEKFRALELPGQPMMHMGTRQLVNDLWNEVEDLRLRLEGALYDSDK